MKTLLTLFILFFSSYLFGKETKFDLYHFLNEGYEIISVSGYKDRGVLYVLQYKNEHFVHCIYYINGQKAQCFLMDK